MSKVGYVQHTKSNIYSCHIYCILLFRLLIQPVFRWSKHHLQIWANPTLAFRLELLNGASQIRRRDPLGEIP